MGKKRMSKESLDQLLTDFAHAAKKYLVDIGCVREADNVEPIWARTEDICEAIGAPVSMWSSIRTRILELGTPLATAPFCGYFIGKDGEQSSLLIHKRAMIRGIAYSFNEDMVALSRGGTLEQALEMAERFGYSLTDSSKICRALGVPLPVQIEKMLIESG